MKLFEYRWPWEIMWILTLIVVLAFGLWAGYRITAAYKDTEIMDLQARLETANASLAEANVELTFWQNTIKRLVEGEKIADIDVKQGRPSRGD